MLSARGAALDEACLQRCVWRGSLVMGGLYSLVIRLALVSLLHQQAAVMSQGAPSATLFGPEAGSRSGA